MNNPTIKSTVGVQMSPEGMTAAAKSFDQVLKSTITQLNKAAQTADKAVHSSAQAGQAAAQQINGQLKALAITLSQLRTLQNTLKAGNVRGGLLGAGTVGGFGNERTLGRQIRQVSEYRAAINGTSGALSTLRQRLTDVEVRAGKAGKALSQSQLTRTEKIQAAAQAYSKVSQQIAGMRSRIALLSTEGQKAFKPMLDQLKELERTNAKAFGNRRRTNFQPEISATQKLARAMQERLVAREKVEKATRLNIEALRQEGLQITRNTTLEREAALAKSVRAANTRFNNLQLIGGSIRQRDTDQVSRFARATALAAANQNQLTAALNRPNTSARRIQSLIARHKQLQREIGESLAAQNRMQSASSSSGSGRTGFFAGLAQGRRNAFAGEGSGSFGAGALVGRVGAYAVAASAVYGLISAFQQGISFTIQFEDALAQLQAISGSTSTELTRLSDEIFRVAKNSANSVTELTKSATVIAQAGFAGAEIGQLLESVVNLAGASGSSTDEAVDILTSALGSFQLAASESTRVTDALVGALNDSKLSVNQVQLGLQYVGATARLNNITFNELVSTLGAMADAGIRSGSTMSTGLRQMLVDFIDPSEKLITQLNRVGLTTADIDVKTLGLTEVLTRLRDSGFQAYGALETRAAAAYSVLSSNIPRIQELEAATLRQGAAEEAMAVRTDTVNAKWTQMLNTIGSLVASMGDDLSPLLQLLIELFEMLALVTLTLIKPLTALIGAIFSIGESASTTKFTVEDFAAELEAAGYSAEEAAARANEMGDSLDDVQTALRDTTAEIDTLKTNQASMRQEIGKLISRQDDLAGSNGDLNETTSDVAHQVSILSSRFPALRSEFAKTQGGIAGLIQSLVALDRQASRTLANLARTQLAEAQLNRRAALREGGQLAAGYTRAGPLAYRSPVSSRSPDAGIARRFESLMRTNTISSFRQAQQLVIDNPQLARYFPETSRGLNSVLRNYDESNNTVLRSQETLEGANFAASDVGANLNQDVATAAALAQRAASQGEASGQSPAQIQETLTGLLGRIDSLEEQYEGNQGVLAFLGAARNSTQAAFYSLEPETLSGSSGGGSRPSRRGGGSDRADRRRERDFRRAESLIQREELQYRQQLYQNQLATLRNAPSLEQIPEMMEALDQSLSDYLAAEQEMALTNILAQNPKPAQQEQLLTHAARKAEQTRQEHIQRVAQVLSQAIGRFISDTTRDIELQYDEATRFARRNVERANARLEGLNRPTGTQNVPDYYRTVAQRDADLANERLLRAQIPANQRRIEQRQAAGLAAREELDALRAELSNLGLIHGNQDEVDSTEIVVQGNSERAEYFRDLQQRLEDYELETRNLIDANGDLTESFRVLEGVPTNFSDGLRTAMEAMRIEINSSGSIGQDIIKNLDHPIREAHESFKGFFTDVISGTESVGDAFKKMAGRIIDAILDIVAQAIANQFFELFASTIGASQGGGAAGGGGFFGAIGSALTSFLTSGGAWRGGQVKGYIRGGEIASGLSTRDSTLIHAAKGEYVIRKPSVDSIGTNMLDSINARGAAALNGVGAPGMVSVSAPPVETNVYIISPEEKPSLGPNDVVAIITDDALKGGKTKTLIKKIANG